MQSVEEVFTSTAKDLEEQARIQGIRVDRQSFYGDPADAIKVNNFFYFINYNF